MKESIRYGLLTGSGYIVAVAVIYLMAWGLESIAGGADAPHYSQAIYKVAAVVGLCASFICGFLYPILLSRIRAGYASEYPDVPMRYINEICRGKLLTGYYRTISLVCVICGVALLHAIDKIALLVCTLFACGCIFLLLYFRNRKRYQNI